MSDLYFTADTHFHHRRIIELTGRPFDSVEDMNEAFIDNWNACVKRGDRVYHLGDFSFGNKNAILSILTRLNGQIHLVRGNHDKQLDSLASYFASYGDYKEVTADGQSVVMSHYPFLTWNKAHHGAWALHGHCHGSLQATIQPRYDVGVDANNYRPISFEELQAILATRSYTPVDHHMGQHD